MLLLSVDSEANNPSNLTCSRPVVISPLHTELKSNVGSYHPAASSDKVGQHRLTSGSKFVSVITQSAADAECSSPMLVIKVNKPLFIVNPF
jgi:hypothetical protein